MGSGTRFRVAICGAGIGGLTTAVTLSRFPDIEVEIFESAQQLAELGAGIGLFPRMSFEVCSFVKIVLEYEIGPWEIVKKLGLEEDLLKTTEIKITDGPVSSFKYRKSDGPVGYDFYTLVTKGNLVTFHRPDFQKVLLSKLPPSHKISCSKRLRSYTQRLSGPIDLFFEDGTTSYCDVLVGADGLKSAVRRSLLTEKAQWAESESRCGEASDFIASIEPVWCGTNAYRALIPAERLKARFPGHRTLTQPTQYLGKNGYVIAYPISKGKLVNFVAFKSHHDLENTRFNGPWVCVTESAEFAATFRTWEPEVQALVDCVERPLRWAIHTVKPLKSFVSGRAGIIGDAAHAMTPHQGSGAGQAIEDGYVLATILGHPATTRETIGRSMLIYDQVRRPVAQSVHEVARQNGRIFTFSAPDLDFDHVSSPEEMSAKLQMLSHRFTKNWEWAWTTSAKTVIQDAFRLLGPSRS
ncbi:hypothetical protein K443DRAFT_189327 [Laccaria amethystina LaAM-08-1]|uniref:FAD-binding domain-containing protein n=1 Tax=Laccaria amethystina LaAM-08-1 TaxID=1095629 RepID=A0A0C9WND9_9AGAR|nr:hypothetical protein K443DRAFT_189327 [Laccaria amethystina LaAM-08-1]